MPRKDGKPTLAEKRDAERREGNAEFIRKARTETLHAILSPSSFLMLDDETEAMVRAEIVDRVKNPRAGGEQ